MEFSTVHPNDYRLISEDWAIAFARKEHMPSFEFMKERIATQLGGAPREHTRLALALVARLHGTAALLLPASSEEKIFRDFRQDCIAVCEALIHAASTGVARTKRVSRAGG